MHEVSVQASTRLFDLEHSLCYARPMPSCLTPGLCPLVSHLMQRVGNLREKKCNWEKGPDCLTYIHVVLVSLRNVQIASSATGSPETVALLCLKFSHNLQKNFKESNF